MVSDGLSRSCFYADSSLLLHVVSDGLSRMSRLDLLSGVFSICSLEFDMFIHIRFESLSRFDFVCSLISRFTACAL